MKGAMTGLTIAALAAVLALGGCGKKGNPKPPPSETGATAPAPQPAPEAEDDALPGEPTW